MRQCVSATSCPLRGGWVGPPCVTSHSRLNKHLFGWSSEHLLSLDLVLLCCEQGWMNLLAPRFHKHAIPAFWGVAHHCDERGLRLEAFQIWLISFLHFYKIRKQSQLNCSLTEHAHTHKHTQPCRLTRFHPAPISVSVRANTNILGYGIWLNDGKTNRQLSHHTKTHQHVLQARARTSFFNNSSPPVALCWFSFHFAKDR